MYVQAPEALDEACTAIVADELNVKKVEFVEDAEGFISYSFKPNLRTVGPKYGKQLGLIRNTLSSVDGAAAMAELKETGMLKIGAGIVLLEEDLLVETAQKEGFVAESGNGVTVVLDTNLSEELLEEGFVREVVSKVQTMRKEAGFEVMDHIAFAYGDNQKITQIVTDNAAAIQADTLTDELVAAADDSFYVKEWNVNGEKVTFGVKKL